MGAGTSSASDSGATYTAPPPPSSSPSPSTASSGPLQKFRRQHHAENTIDQQTEQPIFEIKFTPRLADAIYRRAAESSRTVGGISFGDSYSTYPQYKQSIPTPTSTSTSTFRHPTSTSAAPPPTDPCFESGRSAGRLEAWQELQDYIQQFETHKRAFEHESSLRESKREKEEVSEIGAAMTKLEEARYKAPQKSPVCETQALGVLQCYRTSVLNPLVCADVVAKFLQCSNQAKSSSFQQIHRQ